MKKIALKARKNRKVSCSKRIASERRWNYRLKLFFYYRRTNNKARTRHRVRDWMSISMHCTIERIFFKFHYYIFHTIYSKYLFYLPYDIILGLLCCYKMREIINFWKLRRR